MTHRTIPGLRALTCLIVLLAPGAGWGQVMVSPSAVLGTDLGTYSDETPLRHLIDQSGVERPFVSGTTPFDSYFAVPHQTLSANSPEANWQSEVFFTLPVQGYIDFDLGESRTVTKVALWTVTPERMTLRFSEDPASLATAPSAGTFTLFNHSSFVASYGVDILTLPTPQRGRYLRLGIESVYLFVPGLTFTYAILGEVVVSAAPSGVPSLSIARQSDGDVELTFTGTLQSASSLDGPFTDVPGTPVGSHVLSAAGLAAQQFFRVR